MFVNVALPVALVVVSLAAAAISAREHLKLRRSDRLKPLTARYLRGLGVRVDDISQPYTVNAPRYKITTSTGRSTYIDVQKNVFLADVAGLATWKPDDDSILVLVSNDVSTGVKRAAARMSVLLFDRVSDPAAFGKSEFEFETNLARFDRDARQSVVVDELVERVSIDQLREWATATLSSHALKVPVPHDPSAEVEKRIDQLLRGENPLRALAAELCHYHPDLSADALIDLMRRMPSIEQITAQIAAQADVSPP